MKQLTLEEYYAQVDIEIGPLLERQLEIAKARDSLPTHEQKMASYEEAKVIWEEIGAIIEQMKAQMIPGELARLEIIATNKGLLTPSFIDALIAYGVKAQGTIH